MGWGLRWDTQRLGVLFWRMAISLPCTAMVLFLRDLASFVL